MIPRPDRVVQGQTAGRQRSRSACCAKRSDTSPGLPASPPVRRPAGAQLPAVRPSGRRVGRAVAAARGADAPGRRTARAARSGSAWSAGVVLLRRHALLDSRRAADLRRHQPAAGRGGGRPARRVPRAVPGASWPSSSRASAARVGPRACSWRRRSGWRPNWRGGGSSAASRGCCSATARPACCRSRRRPAWPACTACRRWSRWRRRRSRWPSAGRGRARWLAPAAAACLVGGLAAWGAWRVHGRLAAPRRARRSRVALVQGNIPQDEKWDQAARRAASSDRTSR